MTGEWTAEKMLARFAEREWRLSGVERVEMTDQEGPWMAVECWADNGRLLHETEIRATDMVRKLARFTAQTMMEAQGQTTMAR